MNAAQRDALESAGFRIGTVQDFLGLEDWENQYIELKCRIRKTVKRLREVHELTQQDVARRIKSSQSRIAKIESGAEDVSLDLLVRYLFAVGGNLRDLAHVASETVAAGTTPAAKPVTSRKKERAP